MVAYPPNDPPRPAPIVPPNAAAFAFCIGSKDSCSPAVILADCLKALSAAVYAAPSNAPTFAPCFIPTLVASFTPAFIPCFNACAPAVAVPKVPIPK